MLTRMTEMLDDLTAREDEANARYASLKSDVFSRLGQVERATSAERQLQADWTAMETAGTRATSLRSARQSMQQAVEHFRRAMNAGTDA